MLKHSSVIQQLFSTIFLLPLAKFMELAHLAYVHQRSFYLAVNKLITDMTQNIFKKLDILSFLDIP